MTRHGIQREKLGSLTKIGQGGQGVVYSAPGFRTKFTDSMVYKEYKSEALESMNFEALTAMPALVEDSMSYDDAERLISIAAWPCAIIEEHGSPIGQVMPAIPDRFTIPLTTAKGTSYVNAEIQHLLNHRSILAARGIQIDDAQKYSLLREIAAELAFLHRSGICVGDISPKNLLFSLEPTAATYFIDCDTMRVNTVSALPQVETPGWEVPDGEELATVYSDSYKLGLLALRLLVGDQEVRDPKRIPPKTPNLLRKLITDSLTSTPEKRPLPTAWTYILGHAIEEAQQLVLDGGASTESESDPAPSIPVVRARPQPQPSRKSAPPRAVTPSIRAATPASSPPSAATNQPVAGSERTNYMILAGVAAVVLAALVVVGVVIATSSSNTPTTRTAKPSYPSSYEEPSSSTSTPRETSPMVPQTTQATEPLLSRPDSAFLPPNDPSCTDEIRLQRNPDRYAVRGSPKTSCVFAGNVGDAYLRSGPPERRMRLVSAEGKVGCSTVDGNPRCTANDNFIMECSIHDGENWITCTGGDRAIVYIY